MFKRLFLAAALALLTACASTPGDPRQQAVDATFKSAATLDAAVTATRAAIQSGALKGQDAAKALQGLEASVAGVKSAQASLAATPPAVPASGVK